MQLWVFACSIREVQLQKLELTFPSQESPGNLALKLAFGLITTREGMQCHSSANNWIKVLLSKALLIRSRPSFSHCQSLPLGSLHLPNAAKNNDNLVCYWGMLLLLLLLLLLSRFSRVWLLATPWTAAYQAPPSMGFSGQQYWSGVPLPSPTYCVAAAAAAAAKSLQSCPTLCDPIDGSPPGFSVHGIFQARILEWGAIAFSAQTNWPVIKYNNVNCLLWSAY